MWGGAEDAGQGGFKAGRRGRMPTGTMLQFLWFLGHIMWILSFFSSSMSLENDERSQPTSFRSAHSPSVRREGQA